MTPEQADSRLADAIWWFKGFAVATQRRCAMDCDQDPTEGLGESLRSVRNWIDRLSRGSTRLIGTNERTYAIALTEQEFEVLFDGIRSEGNLAEVGHARALAGKILAEFQAEVKAAHTPEPLF